METLKQARKTMRYSQQQVAEILGITRQTYIKIEQGKTKPSVELAFKMSSLFKVPVKKLFSEE